MASPLQSTHQERVVSIQPRQSLKAALDRLARITARLRRLALVAVFCTIVNLAIAVVVSTQLPLSFSPLPGGPAIPRTTPIGTPSATPLPDTLASRVTTPLDRQVTSLLGSVRLIHLLYVSLLLSSISLVSLMIYEYQRREGNLLFEEVSDELEWDARGAKPSETSPPTEQSPALEARVILRAFVRASDLPFVPGRYGVALYLAVNVILMFLALWLPSLYS